MAPIRIPSGSYTNSSAVSAGASTAPPSSGWDYILKFILIGDSSVGKSSLLVRLTDDRFLTDPDPTIGVEFGSHLIRLDNGETVKVQVWDTAGSESFRSITRSYYRGAAGALLVYDVTHRASFLNVKAWLDDVRAHAEEKVSVVLVGNMYDLVENETPTREAEQEQEQEQEPHDVQSSGERKRTDRRRSKGSRRQVTYQEAAELAEREGLLFLEASAKTGYNVVEAFTRAAKDVHSKFSQDDNGAGSPDARGEAGSGARYDSATLGKRSRMRARAGGRTSGTVSLDQQTAQPQAKRNVSGLSFRSLTGGGGGANVGQHDAAADADADADADGADAVGQARAATSECCVIC